MNIEKGSLENQYRKNLDRFPVEGDKYSFSNDFNYPREGGRKHLGIDIFDTCGKLLLYIGFFRIRLDDVRIAPPNIPELI